MSPSSKTPTKSYEEIPARKMAKQLTPAAMTILISSIIFAGEFVSILSAISLVSSWLCYFGSAVAGGIVWYRLTDVDRTMRASDPDSGKSPDAEPESSAKINPDSDFYERRKVRGYSRLQLWLFILATSLLIVFGILTALSRIRNKPIVLEPPRSREVPIGSISPNCSLFKGCSENDFKAFFGYATLSPTLKTEIQNTFKGELSTTFKTEVNNTFKAELKPLFDTQLEIKAEINSLRNICVQHCRCDSTPPPTRSSHHAQRRLPTSRESRSNRRG